MLPQAAGAQPVRDISGLAVELAYDYCLPCAEGRVRIDGPELKALGFAAPVARKTHPRAGQIEMVELKWADGSITFAVSSDATFCQVNVFGPNAAAAHANLRSSLPRLNRKFAPDAPNSFNRNGIQVETLNARLDSENILFVQFVRAVGPAADMTGFQIGALEQ